MVNKLIILIMILNHQNAKVKCLRRNTTRLSQARTSRLKCYMRSENLSNTNRTKRTPWVIIIDVLLRKYEISRAFPLYVVFSMYTVWDKKKIIRLYLRGIATDIQPSVKRENRNYLQCTRIFYYGNAPEC